MLLLAALAVGWATPLAAAELRLDRTLDLPGVRGRIDHLAIDVAKHRLFIAALGNDTVEIVDTATGGRTTLHGAREPQGVAYLPGSNQLWIANGRGDRIDVVDAASRAVLRGIGGLPDADNLHIDAAGAVWVGYGGGALRGIDPTSAASLGEMPLPGHPEGFALERQGRRVFVNVPSAGEVVVLDRATRSVVARWALTDAAANFPMALDEADGRLFVGTRTPALLLVYDTATGRNVGRLSTCGDADDLFYDSAVKHIYVACGAGRVDVFRQDGPDRYRREASVPTAPGARTALLVPEERRLYVAAPARAGAPARVLVYRID